ncbi:hypothetical protein CARUB_v10021693mg [Capsella rubella]|uniref:heme oxygenase (biliverdin-producing) n=1 Tax=Capsella rubella TaxID=81985 RepID=R0I5K8_9BRAS|nr:hypothetical protein CARUB_v10021693mg [Capsella rubella]
MPTARLNASSYFPVIKSLDIESYVTTPRQHLVRRANEASTLVVNAMASVEDKPTKIYPGETKGFVEEMRYVVMRLHPRAHASEGKKDGPVSPWSFTIEGYLKFLVDSKLVFDTLETIVHESTVPAYAGLKNTGLERAENLRRDLEWFKEQGHEIPEPMASGKTYSQYLKNIAEKDHPALICHFYNIYFAHSSGGRMVGTKVSAKILDNKELEFYKWDGQLSELLQNVGQELNKVAELWTREEKNHCLEETETSFKLYWEIFNYLLP